MKSNAKSALVFALTASMVFSSAGVSEAKAKKPTLSKTKTTITVGKKQKITVKKVKPKKTTWSLTKKGKKIVSISKKKKTSVYIRGKKVGKATLTAKIKVGKKNYKKTVKITVKNKTAPTVTPKPPVNNATPKPNKPTPTPTNKPPVNNATPVPNKPTPTPTATPGVIKPVEDEKNGTLTYDNLDSAADYTTTVNGKDRDICGKDIAAELDRAIDVADFYEKWTTKTTFEKSLCGREIEIVTKDSTNLAVKEVTVKATDSRVDGVYTVTVNPKVADGTYTVNVVKTTGARTDLVVTSATDKVTVAGTYNGKAYTTEIALDAEKKASRVTIKRNDAVLVTLTKKADGTYALVLDKAEAEKRGFVLAKK